MTIEYTLSVIIHGYGGVGKSWLADSTPAPRLVLDAEGRSKFTPSGPKILWDPVSQEPPVDDGTWETCVVFVREYDILNRVFQWLNSGQHPFQSVVFDSLTEIQKRCYVPDTDVLTPTGWKRIGEVRTDDEVAQYEDGIGRVSFVHPTDVQEFTHNGPIHMFSSAAHGIAVTPDHRMLVQTQQNRLGEVLRADDVRIGHFIPTAGYLDGSVGPTTLEARILASIQADATYHGHKIIWAFRKERKKERLRQLLKEYACPFDEITYDDHRTTSFRTHRSNLPFVMEYLPKKRWQWNAVMWPLSVKRALIEELRFWDGSSKTLTRVAYGSSVQENIDVLMAVAATTGYSVNGRRSGILSLMPYDRRRVTSLQQEHYTGPVHCISVPSGFILARRDGRVSISGNCVDHLVGTAAMQTQDWGTLLRNMDGLVRDFRDLTFHPIKSVQVVVFTCLTSEKNGRITPLVQGSLRDTLQGLPDVIGYMYTELGPDGTSIARKLLIQPYGQFLAKDNTDRLTKKYGMIIDSPNLTEMWRVVGQTEEQ